MTNISMFSSKMTKPWIIHMDTEYPAGFLSKDINTIKPALSQAIYMAAIKEKHKNWPFN